MPNYTGCQCKVCQNHFKETDDIVVCPDCGTPYHRSCYASKGQCINTELHASGKSWQELHRSDLEKRECPNCRHINAPEASHCAVCHAPMHANAQPNANAQNFGEQRINILLSDGRTMSIDPNDPCCGMSPNEELDGVRLGDLASFVRTNTLYYIPLFKRFKDTGKKISVNLPCLLFPHLYFANRKMWLMTFLSIIALVLCSIPSMFTNMLTVLTTETYIEMYQETYGMDITELFAGMLTFLEQHEDLLYTLDMIFYGIQLTVRVVLCIFANHIYYRHALKKVRAVRNSGASPQVKHMLLQSDGGTNFLNMFGAIALFVGVQIAIMMVAMLPFMM